MLNKFAGFSKIIIITKDQINIPNWEVNVRFYLILSFLSLCSRHQLKVSLEQQWLQLWPLKFQAIKTTWSFLFYRTMQPLRQ